MNKAGASFTDSEMELSQIVKNAQNVGFVEAMKRSALGKNPLDAINAYIPQLKREALIIAKNKGYTPAPPPSKVVVDSSVFNKLSGSK
jgi:hypothetical protein